MNNGLTMVFVNLPAANLERSKAFYVALGCSINPFFTNEDAACAMWDQETFFMLLTHEHFARFTDRPIVDASAQVQVILSFARGSRDDVDATVAAGIKAGGIEPRDAVDYGYMCQRSIEDPDGHLLEFFFMEPQAAEVGPEAYVTEHGAGPDQVPSS